MGSIALTFIVFVCLFGGGLLGLFLRTKLPEHHLSADSRSAVTVGMGMVGTMAALVLGLLVASAATSFDTQRNELTEVSAKIVLLDHLLAQYGPETKASRELLRGAVAGVLDRLWPEGPSRTVQPEPNANADVIYETILELSPKDEPQRTLKLQALNVALELSRTRWLMYEQEGITVATPLLVVVVFWLTIMFISFGLFAPSNATVITTLFVAALSVSGAIFLVVEMYQPFAGVIRIPSAPLRNALAHLGQ